MGSSWNEADLFRVSPVGWLLEDSAGRVYVRRVGGWEASGWVGLVTVLPADRLYRRCGVAGRGFTHHPEASEC